MSLQLGNITFDCEDPVALAGFWSDVLERPVDPGASPFFATIGSGDTTTPTFMFLKVPEPKTAKNRCHVDLMTDDRPSVQTEADRLVGLGAKLLRDPKEEFGHYWSTLQDPEGNEFCIGAP